MFKWSVTSVINTNVDYMNPDHVLFEGLGKETQTDGTTTAKSPAGMFDDSLIPNDLGYVKQKMEEYYNG